MSRGAALMIAIIASLLIGGAAAAQPADKYPSRTVTIVVPFPAGGSIDAVARVLAERMQATLNAPFVVENVTGAAGTIGVGRVAKAEPDGHTIGIGNLSTHVINGATATLSYDAVKDFAPVALLTREPMVIGGRQSLPASDLNGLLAWLKANPGKATVATGGRGDVTEIVSTLFMQQTATKVQLVAYRGTVAAISDLMNGSIDLVFMQASSLIAQESAGNMKAFAVMAPHRMPANAAIPTIDEAGLPKLYVDYWFGLWTPKGTPRAIVDVLYRAAAAALADPSAQQRLNAPGREIYPKEQQTPEALRALQDAEIKRWWPVIKAMGLKPG